jgi:hypothetical protein
LAGVPPCFLCLFGAPDVGRVREPRGLKIIEKVKLKIGGRSTLFLTVFGAPNLGRVQEPRGLKLIEKVKFKKWRAFRPVFHVFLVLIIEAEYESLEASTYLEYKTIQSVCLSVYLSVCVSVCLSVFLFVFLLSLNGVISSLCAFGPGGAQISAHEPAQTH